MSEKITAEGLFREGSMKYGMDLDGVLANFGARVIDAANTLWPGKLSPDFVPDNWDYIGTFTKEEWVQVWSVIKATPHFWLNIKPTRGAVDLHNGMQYDDNIYFITARAQTLGESPLVQSSLWLREQGLWSRNGHSTIIPVGDSKNKKLVFQGLGLKYMLDDYAPTVEELNAIGVHAFVFDQPWNRYATHLPRVYSVSEYLIRIRQIESGE